MAATPELFYVNREQEEAIKLYAVRAQDLLLNQFSIRNTLENIDRYYMRENDYTEANLRNRAASKAGDKSKMQDVTVPVVMPQVEAALGYMTNVWLTGSPIFGVSGDPTVADAAMQMETIISENSRMAGWARQLLMFFRDGLKYNIHGVECDWQEWPVPSVDTDISYPNSAKPKKIVWKGNVLRRMDMYNTFFDPRVHPSESHCEGEYAGYIQVMSRIRMKKYINSLYGQVKPSTLIRALESSIGGNVSATTPYQYYVPSINPEPLMNNVQSMLTFDWMAWAMNTRTAGNTGLNYSNVYQVMKLYARIMPSDFGFKVPEENTPQIWKFIIVNGQVVVYAERCSNAHDYIPIFFGQPLEDGLDYQTKSFATNVTDMQDVASAMWNGYLASKRRLVGDRVLYDPLRVREKDINSTNPAAKIPVRPAAFGKPVGEAVYAFPFHDEQTSSFLQGSEMVVKFANIINNQNPAQQGQFVKGNKTRHEYEDIMGHGNNHNQVMAISTEQQVFTPLKLALKLNILQYQPEGVVYNMDKKVGVEIKPEELRKQAVHFIVSDGLQPSDKLMGTEEFRVSMEAMASSPQLSAGYNMVPAFTYLMKLQGTDLSPFEKSQLQIQYEQDMQTWQNTALEYLKAGKEFKIPQPQMPPELVKLLQQGPKKPASSAALDSTTGAASDVRTP